MGETQKICKSCGRPLLADNVCIHCTVTDAKFSDTIAETVSNRAIQLGERLVSPAFLTDETSQRQIPITGAKCKVGRDPTNQIVIGEDQYTSRFHAFITFEESHYFIEDLGSTNGTLLNGSPLITRRPLVNGDHVRIGRREFRFNLEGSSLPGRSNQSSGQLR